MKEKYWKYSLIIIIIGLGIILFRQITPFLGGLLGALTIYILVRKQMIYLGARMKRSFAALLITGEAILCFLVPISLIVWMLVNKLQDINLDPQAIITPVEELAGIIKAKTGYDVLGSDTLSFIVSLLPKIGQAVMGGISSFAVNLFVLVFVLYFMLPDDLFAKTEPDSASFRFRCEERNEDLFPYLFRYAGAIIFYLDLQTVCPPYAENDSSVRLSLECLHRIFQQIKKDL